MFVWALEKDREIGKRRLRAAHPKKSRHLAVWNRTRKRARGVWWRVWAMGVSGQARTRRGHAHAHALITPSHTMRMLRVSCGRVGFGWVDLRTSLAGERCNPFRVAGSEPYTRYITTIE